MERIATRITVPGDAHHVRRNNCEELHELKTDNPNIVQYLTKKAGEIHTYTHNVTFEKKKPDGVLYIAYDGGYKSVEQ